MTDKIDAIFFDCFDTILDEHDRTGLCCIPRLSIELGFFQEESEFFDHYIPVCRRPDGRETQLNDRLLLALGKSTRNPKVPTDLAISQMLSGWLNEYPPSIRPAPGVEKMLAHWHGRKKIGMISNFFLPDWPRKLLQREGLDHYFDFIINSAEFGYRKPHKNIYEHALSRIGKIPSQANSVLFIGDRVDLDIDPPKAMGMNVLHYKNPPRGTEPHPTPPDVESITHWDQFR
jgi:FMN phosphatase YigB (HAD superfamily)